MAAGSGTEGTGDDDRLAWGSLDDDFVRGAGAQEAAADERIERLRRIDAEHRRLLDERRRAMHREEGHRVRLERRRPRGVLVVVVLVGIAALIGWSVLFEDGSRGGAGDVASEADAADAAGSTETTAAPTTTTTVQRRPGWPTPSSERQPAPLGAPAPLEVESASYAFIEVQRRSPGPVAFDPCRPIHVVHNLSGAPAEAPELLAEALGDVSLATGLQFIVDGETDEPPDALGRRPYQLHRYGDRWAPVLVAWSDETAVPDLAGLTAGLAGSSWVDVGSTRVYVSGLVILDAPDLSDGLDAGDRDGVGGVIRHELAHLVGLDHVDDTAELMHPEGVPGVVTFGPGDLTGLAQLGRGQCFADL